MKTNAFDKLTERGFVHSCTHPHELKKMLEKPVTFYLGIDPTADNLHIGHFFGLQIFKILQDHGHKGILLIGNATAMIGDPSFKNDMRKLLTQDEVDRNAREINALLNRFINLDGANPAIVVRNNDWFKTMGWVEFARNVGQHFNVAEMLTHDCYKNRMNKGLTLFEMCYMPMQAYDFIHLNDKYNCTLQIGGSDQWANITAGVELSRKMSLVETDTQNPQRVAPAAPAVARPTMVGMCCPLLVKADGTKMGKTEKGTLWVSRGENISYDCYQYFVNVFDEDVERLMMFFTDIPPHEVQHMCMTDIVNAKKQMAFAVTAKIHGTKEAERARDTSAHLFGTGSGAPADVPTETVKIAKGANIVDILSATSVASSKREAREFITAGAISIDGEKITDINFVPKTTDLLVKKGKKTYLRIIISSF